MKFQHLAVSALLCLVLVGGSHARGSIADEDYWKAVWPNTPIPNTLQELLKSGTEDAEVNHLSKKNKDLRLQYVQNIFIQQDLHPGNTMDLVFKQSYLSIFYPPQSLRDLIEITYEDVCVKKPTSNYCAKSLGQLIGFAISKLGKNIELFSSSFIDKQNKYTIEGVQNLGEKAVTCRKMYSPQVVFVCHQTKRSIAYKVPLVAADGNKTHAIALCHVDKPGRAAVCHFLANDALLWVPNFDMENASLNHFAS